MLKGQQQQHCVKTPYHQLPTVHKLIHILSLKIVRADPVSNKNVTGTLLIVAATEKEELGLTIDIIGLNKLQVFALDVSLGGRAPSPRETNFPDVRVSSLVVRNP